MKRPVDKVFFIGFMASGKTKLGKALAERLGWPFIDTDSEVEAAQGLSVADIFSREGEARFRRLEALAVARAARGSSRVVSVGGGAVLDPGNVAAMRRAGVVVYRQASLARIFERGERRGEERRPLWKGRTRAERLRAVRRLYLQRRSLYRGAAHLAFRVEGDPEEVSARLLRRLLSEGWLRSPGG